MNLGWLCAQFDGAARVNPQGLASWCVALWWGRWCIDGFVPAVLLEKHARPIGIGTNNKAEYLGRAFALELVLRRHIRTSQHLRNMSHPRFD